MSERQAIGPVRGLRPAKQRAAACVSDDSFSIWSGLVSQVMGPRVRTPQRLTEHRLNALHLAAAALKHAGESGLYDQVLALAAEVEIAPVEL